MSVDDPTDGNRERASLLACIPKLATIDGRWADFRKAPRFSVIFGFAEVADQNLKRLRK